MDDCQIVWHATCLVDAMFRLGAPLGLAQSFSSYFAESESYSSVLRVLVFDTCAPILFHLSGAARNLCGGAL